MATIRLDEIQQLLADRGETDALPWSSGGFFLEISFERPDRRATRVVDPEWANRAMQVETPYGSALLRFDSEGMLIAIEVS